MWPRIFETKGFGYRAALSVSSRSPLVASRRRCFISPCASSQSEEWIYRGRNRAGAARLRAFRGCKDRIVSVGASRADRDPDNESSRYDDALGARSCTRGDCNHALCYRLAFRRRGARWIIISNSNLFERTNALALAIVKETLAFAHDCPARHN